MGSVGIEGEGFGAVGEKEIEAGAHPADPKDIESKMETFLQQSMAICMHKILEGEDEAKSAGDEEDGTHEVGQLFRGAASHNV